MTSSSSAHTPPAVPDLERILSARRLDLGDPAGLRTSCRAHHVAETGLQAVLDAFGPLSDTLDVYVTV